ncbi:MAG TPA: carbohydrate ABC transporter permease [Thermomicrobiales bacterium]|nr:carbohydrate ABC transporter permease [Thermomicrobiales bacterium]
MASTIRYRQQQQMGRFLGYLAMILLVVVVGAPVFWMVTGALKTTQQIYTFPPEWIPLHPHWDNFSHAWHAAPFGRFYINSAIITIVGSTLELTNATLTAYALAFLRFPKKNLVFILLLAALMIPSQVTILPNYIFLGRTLNDWIGMSWINTYQGIILPGASVAFGTFMLRQSFMGMPREVLDAAKVDGCGHLRVLWDIVIPMSRPVLVTFGLISLVAKWNDYLWPLIITNDNKVRPLTVGISYLFDSEGNTDWGVVMAATVFVIMPLLIVFLWAQRYIIEGITAGATKG